MATSSKLSLVTLFLCCGLIAACNGTPSKPDGVTIGGIVLMPNGSPLSGGTLILRPESGLYGATGAIQSDGTFTLQDSGKPTVVPGRYQVFVRFSEKDTPNLKSSVHQRYQQSSEDGDSDVVVDIQESSDNLQIRLNR